MACGTTLGLLALSLGVRPALTLRLVSSATVAAAVAATAAAASFFAAPTPHPPAIAAPWQPLPWPRRLLAAAAAVLRVDVTLDLRVVEEEAEEAMEGRRLEMSWRRPWRR